MYLLTVLKARSLNSRCQRCFPLEAPRSSLHASPSLWWQSLPFIDLRVPRSHLCCCYHLAFFPVCFCASLSKDIGHRGLDQCTWTSVQSLSRVWLFVTPWIAAHQASLSITNSRSLLKLMPIELVMPSSHLILCCPLLLLPPIPPSIRVFSNESTLRSCT